MMVAKWASEVEFSLPGRKKGQERGPGRGRRESLPSREGAKAVGAESRNDERRVGVRMLRRVGRGWIDRLRSVTGLAEGRMRELRG